MAKQINVFVENKPGRFRKVTQILSEAGINIRAIQVQDRGDFGVMKLLVNDPDRGHLLLSDAGFATALKDVLAIVVDDKPGGLLKLAEMFEKEQMNMLDAYGFIASSGNEAVWCTEVTDIEAAATLIEKAGFRILNPEELYDL